MVQYYKYDPFGEITQSSDSLRVATPFLYVGKYGVMYETPHLYYMRARYYDPVSGRFLGEDKNWGPNLFSYGGNNPLSNIDPNGRQSTIPYEDLLNYTGLITKFLIATGLTNSTYQGDAEVSYFDSPPFSLQTFDTFIEVASLVQTVKQYQARNISKQRLIYEISKDIFQNVAEELLGEGPSFLIAADIFIWEQAAKQWEIYEKSKNK